MRDEEPRRNGMPNLSMPTRLVAVARRTVSHAIADDVVGLSAELAYRFFLALFPFAIFVASLGALAARYLSIENPAQQLVDRLAFALPSEAATLVRRELQRVMEQQDAGIVSFAILAAIFFATGGTNAVIKALNRAFDVPESRPLWRRYLVALFITLLAGTGLVAAFVMFVSGRVVADELASRLGLGVDALEAFRLLTWPVTIVILLVSVTILYRLAPNLRLPLHRIMPGAAAFTVLWTASTLGFSFYVSNFATYGATYGALAGVAVLLIWFYITAFALLIGGEINAALAPDPRDNRES